MSIDFPTSPKEVRPKRVGKISDVRTGYNASYGPDGRNGLYLTIQFRSGKDTDFFYPSPPNTRTTMLLESLGNLGIAPAMLENGQWEDLIGYTLEWETVMVPTSFTDKNTAEKVKRTVSCDVPCGIVARPGEEVPSANSNGTGAGAVMDKMAFDALCEIALEMANGVSPRQLVWALERDERVKAMKGAMEAIQSGSVQDTLVENNQLAVVDGKYKVN